MFFFQFIQYKQIGFQGIIGVSEPDCSLVEYQSVRKMPPLQTTSKKVDLSINVCENCAGKFEEKFNKAYANLVQPYKDKIEQQEERLKILDRKLEILKLLAGPPGELNKKK